MDTDDSLYLGDYVTYDVGAFKTTINVIRNVSCTKCHDDVYFSRWQRKYSYKRSYEINPSNQSCSEGKTIAFVKVLSHLSLKQKIKIYFLGFLPTEKFHDLYCFGKWFSACNLFIENVFFSSYCLIYWFVCFF